jgi:hypothetical protein
MKVRVLAIGAAIAAVLGVSLGATPASAQAVEPPPTVNVTVDATPTTLPAPGGTFTYTVRITNTSAETIRIVSLDDSVYGDLDNWGTCTTQQNMVPGSTYQCSYTGTFTGVEGSNQTNVVEVVANDATLNQARDTDDATVVLTAGQAQPVTPPVGQPTVDVQVTPSPVSRPAPGGNFTFHVRITNTSNETIRIVSLDDSVYGDLDNRGTCTTQQNMLPGTIYDCSYDGSFTGSVGASQTSIVDVVANDADLNQARDSDDATVSLTGVSTADLHLGVQKTASPERRQQPGGLFDITVVVANLSPVPVTISSVVDDVYGDVGTNGRCPIVGTRLQPGSSTSCTYTGFMNGVSGQVQRSVTTVTAVDDSNRSVQGFDDVAFTLTSVLVVDDFEDEDDGQTSIPITGRGITNTAAIALAVGSFGLLFVGLADERRRRAGTN